MKLACKRYGDALNARDKFAIMNASDSQFARVWSRVPSEIFMQMPRGGGGHVIRSTKTGSSGTVTVSSTQGVMTFHLVGQGFQWQVADIIRTSSDGRAISVREALDISLTTREFLTDLKKEGGAMFHDSLSASFRSAFAQLSLEQLNYVRQFLSDPSGQQIPQISIEQSRATMTIPIPHMGPQDFIVFKLVKEWNWKIDDFTIASTTVRVPSFRQALPLIASVSAFRAFLTTPERVDPAVFTTSGALRHELEQARYIKPFPLPLPGQYRQFIISDDMRQMTIQYPDRTIRVAVCQTPGRVGRMDGIEVKMGAKWSDVSGLLAMQRRVNGLSTLGTAFTSWTLMPTSPKRENNVVPESAPQPKVSTAGSVFPSLLKTPFTRAKAKTKSSDDESNNLRPANAVVPQSATANE